MIPTMKYEAINCDVKKYSHATHSFIHLFSKYLFTEHLFCARHCSRFQELNSEQDKAPALVDFKEYQRSQKNR